MILIVDDTPENIFSLRSLLEINKYQVDSASSGEEALRKILKNSYSLIILDVQMPGMDGFEVAEALSGYSKASDIPIIFLSAANTHKKFITRGYESGGMDYVTKPFDPDILLLKVRTFTRLYEQARELNEVQKVLRREIEYKTIAEAGLKQSVDELRSILESIPQIAFTTLQGGRIEFVNSQWYEYARHKNVFPETPPGSQSILDCLTKAITQESVFQCDVQIRRINDQVFRYHFLVMTPVKKDNFIVKWVGIFTDVHEQKMAEQILENKVEERTGELNIMNKELEDRNNELQQFAFVASHDLQEPLRKIQMFSTIVRERFLQGTDEAEPYINKVISSSERMRALINDLLSYSGLSAEVSSRKVDLNVVLENILIDLEVLIKTKSASVSIGKLPVIEAIPSQMQQLFQNLLQNALKFSREDVSPEIRIDSRMLAEKSFDALEKEDGQFCLITVSDNGIGFNEQYVGRIFTIFQRLSSEKKYEGTGIGLAIVKKVIDKHNGLIKASATENEGATFQIILPVLQHSPASSK